jgi:primosomal protein N' (replication factor Y)
VVPGIGDARRIAAGLRREGLRVALGFDDWAVAASGATVVGTRTAVWLPMPRLAAVVVLDEHSEGLQSEQAPTWHARDVALERARRVGAPAVLVSPVPTLEALEAGELQTADRAAERDGWPLVDVLDRRLDDPVRGGLFAEGLRDRLAAASGRVAVVLNRKGRGRLLACKACGELARTSDGRVPMRLIDEELVAADGSERRPVVCAGCGSTVLRNLRIGVTRAREDLAALAGEPVGELIPDSGGLGAERIVIGTEAVLWRLESAAAVVFLDFDQEVLAPRQRASEQALAMLARGARLAGGRRAGGRLIVQTRQPDHPVVRAAVLADPSIAATAERERRRALGLPPFSAQAKVSGPGAEAFIAALEEAGDTAVSIRGPVDGQYLLRVPTHEPLLGLLAATPRPPERLRLEVDPLRA